VEVIDALAKVLVHTRRPQGMAMGSGTVSLSVVRHGATAMPRRDRDCTNRANGEGACRENRGAILRRSIDPGRQP
jgi:hypothetical protein